MKKPSSPTRRAIWQSPDRAIARRGGLLGRLRGPAIWSAMLFATAVMFGGLVWLLTYTPQRTPLHVFLAAPYQWPLPPNAWAKEDIDRLRPLDGETITLRGDTAPIFDARQLTERLRSAVTDAVWRRRGTTPMIVIRMHGVAASPDGPAYLVPPAASPIDADEWFAVDTLLDLIERHPSGDGLLIVLDAQTFQSNWNIGLKQNHFVAAVEHALAARQLPGTFVLASCSRGERAPASAELQGSIFGRRLAWGLAGDADQSSGNQDGWVTLNELVDYLTTNVGRESQALTGSRQTPKLVGNSFSAADTAAAAETRLARSMSAREVADRTGLARETSRPTPPIAYAQLDDLWKRLDRFREAGLYQHEPIAFRDLEHTLLWLEWLTTAGPSYRDLCERTFDDASARMLAAERRLDALTDRPALPELQSVLSGSPPRLPDSIQPHSLPLARYFATLPNDAAAVIDERLQLLSTAPDAALIRRSLKTLDQTTSAELESARFLRMVDRYSTDHLWQRGHLLADLFDKQRAIRLIATPLRDSDRVTDHRTHVWLRRMFRDLDAPRRRAEDCLFQTECEDLEQALADVDAALSPTLAAQTAVDAAIRSCDTSMSQSAYLAAWLMDPRRGGIKTSDVDAVDKTIIPLLQATRELSVQLLQVGEPDASPAELRRRASSLRDRAVKQIEQRLAGLLRMVASRRERILLRAESGDGGVLGDLEALLTLPLLDWQSRRDVRVAYQSLQRRRREDWLRSAGDIPPATSEPKSATADWTKLKRHPLDLIVSADRGTGRKTSGHLISEFSSQLDAACGQAATLPAIEQRRTAFAEQAARVRFAAPVWFPPSTADALRWELRTNLQSLLAWQAERTLDDFWGPAGGAFAFFERAAGDYLAAVQRFDPPVTARHSGDGVSERHALEQKLAAGRKSAAAWIRTVTGPALQLERDEPATAAVSVTGEAAAEGFDPPVGRATVMVRGGNEPPLPARFEPSDSLAVPVLGAKVNVTLSPPDVASFEDLNIQTVFRGHEYGDRMSLQPLGGYRVDIRPRKGRTAEVTLNAPREPLSVAFILDASASMAKGLGGADAGPSRIDIAKDVLRESLTRLADRGNCRAAVRFFGHRIGWSTDKPVRPLPRPDLKPTSTDGLRPSQDVETVLPFGPLNPISVRRVMPPLQSVKPWGQSPLYLSLVESLNDFRNVETIQNTHVIVITDGADYQFIPPGQEGVAATSLNEVKNLWSEVPVPIHIFGLGLDRTEETPAIDAFEQLCRQTGGRFHPLHRAADLKDALSDLLNTGDYRLRRTDGGEASARAAPLGTPLRVQCRPHPQVDCQIEYRNASSSAAGAKASSMIVEPMTLSPGQSVQLYVDAPTRSIRAYPFDQSVAAAVPMTTARQQPADLLVRMHRTRQTGLGVVTFPISWQRVATAGRGDTLDFRATAEPQSVWVQIQPITDDAQPVGEAYVFYDADFVSEQPVPLLELPAEDWPHHATRAAIDVWSRPAGSFPAGRQASSGVTLSPPATETAPNQMAPNQMAPPAGLSAEYSIESLRDSEIEVAQGVRLVLDREDDHGGLKRLRFLVRGDDESVAVTDYKLDPIDGRMGRPDRIVRRFDRRNRVAVHTFFLDPKQAPRFDRVRLVDRSHQTNDAWRLSDGPVTIPVVRSSGFLRVRRLPVP